MKTKRIHGGVSWFALHDMATELDRWLSSYFDDSDEAWLAYRKFMLKMAQAQPMLKAAIRTKKEARK